MVNTDNRRPGTPSPAGAVPQGILARARASAARRPDLLRTPGLTPRQRVAIWIRRHGVAPYLLLLPATAVVGWLVLWPAIQIAIYSFQDYGLPQIAGVEPTRWVGFANYSEIFRDPSFWAALRLTLVFSVVVVPLTLIVGTLVGLLLAQLGKKMATFVSTAALLAWGTPAVSASVIFAWLTSPDGGIVDWTLSKLPSWLGGGPQWAGFSWDNAVLPAYTVLTVMIVWTSFPFVAVTVLAGLRTVPAELLEAARVDGASAWRAFWSITYPLLKPVFLVLLLLSIIWDFGIFTQPFIITGAPGNRDEFNLGLYEYFQAFTQPARYGVGSAVAFILTIILLIITVGYVRASIKQGAFR
ncbi:MAG TPA: sugar ABC transporter permease [Trebonia sp.]|jgi:N,N'-diacetylchitobiose transport system permease protein|nr:sugar ABC transporter permease [Trebonia sp.]